MADGSSATFRVSFGEPLEIQQGEYYVASAKLKVDFRLERRGWWWRAELFSRDRIHSMVSVVFVVSLRIVLSMAK